MAITVVRVNALTASATQLYGATPIAGARRMVVTNNGPNTVYIGSSNAVTTATGHPIPAAQSLIIEAQRNAAIWVIAVTADQANPLNTSLIIDAAE